MGRVSSKPKAARKQVATVVSGAGTDEEIASRCAAEVEGWDKLGEKGKADMIRLMRHFEHAASPPRIQVQQLDDGKKEIGAPDDANFTLNAMRMVQTLGTNSDAFTNDRLSDLINYYSANNRNGATSENLSAALAFIHGGNPTDPVQSSLLVQMNCTHDAALRALAMVGMADFVPQVQLFGNLAAKLLNAYARQAEVLAKLQRGGEQVIKHVHIDNRGGQAVVTEQVVTGGGGTGKVGDQCYAQSACGAALPCPDPLGNIVPMPSYQGQEALPVARRHEPGRAQG
jgi:hypothetical protein